MSAKEPVIRFSPFEALFIGEKNRILKQQPMKNTIFVTRLNQRSKTINLRDLFGPEKSTKTKYNDVIFKMPQRVCDFLRHRRLQNTTNQSRNNDGEVLCYEFEGHKILTKNNKTLLTKSNINNIKAKTGKVKFKRKFKCKDNFHGKVVKKFASGYESKFKSITLSDKSKSSNRKRHLLRGKDGKFIRKSEYEKLKFKEVSPKQKYLSNYLHQLYLKRNKQLFNTWSNNEKNSSELKMSHSVEAIIGLPNSRFDITASESMLNEISEKYYGSNCHEDFQFPNIPHQLEPIDFENDSYLTDLIYENFPKVLRFQSQSETQCSDFYSALLDCNILKPEMNVKIYEKKRNGLVKDEEISEILNRRFPLIKLERINDIMPNHCRVRNERNLYADKIDEPCTKKSHLISGKSFGGFFFRSAEGKDIFIGNLMKPFLQNSWFGSLPES